MRLAPGLHRIGNDLVACYLVVDDSGVTLIDAGLAGQWGDFVAELESLGRQPGDVRGVLLTHGDVDHLGFAERLSREHRVPVWVHEADAARARGEEKPPASARGPFRLTAVARFVCYAARKGGLKTTYLTQVRTLAGGEVLDLPGSPHVIALPGHSPGSVAFHVPAVDALFVGDALTTRHVLTGDEGPAPAPFTDDPELAQASLAVLGDVEATWVLPGHGTPWRDGVPAALRRLGVTGRA